MKKFIQISLIRVFLLFACARPAYADVALIGTPQPQAVETAYADMRVEKLTKYLEKRQSPLIEYAETMIQVADAHDVPWTLVPAITGVESSFGVRMPANSCNAYGWNNGNYKFNSCQESIEHVTKVLKTKYIDRGANTVDKIAPIYAPPSTTWAGKVKFFMNAIESVDVDETSQLAFTL